MRFRQMLNFLTGHHDDSPPQTMPETTADFARPPVVKQDQKHPCDDYTELKLRFRDIGRMNAIIETLGRDFLTAMPQGAYRSRLGHIAFLYRRMHEDLTSKDMRKLLDRAYEHEYAREEEWDDWDSANLREMGKLYRMYCTVSPELMEQKARLSYEGRRRHAAVKKTGDWEQAKEFLSEQIELHKELAEARFASHDESSHYQMLLTEYMPDMKVEEIESLFAQHENALKGLYPKILQKQKSDPDIRPLRDEYEQDAQMWLNKSLLRVIGFDFKRGGLYETGHNPVEGGTPEDTRLVISNVDESNFMDSMKSALHEGGHGLYIQGLPRQIWRYQPVAMDLGAAVQESQALLIEMMIGRMPEFFEFLSPRLEGLFHGINAPALSPENLFAIKTRVNPCLDRKKADEVTYFYHILLRFRLEKSLIDGTLKIEDLPEAWVEGMHQLLGILPNDHMEGCLQDVHWFVGKFGYFPSYVIGHMMAAQIFYCLQKEIPNFRSKIEEGKFKDIKEWLTKNIYSKGRLVDMNTMIKDATGQKLKADYLEKHIKERYLH